MDQTFKYKGYEGSVVANLRDNCLHGKLLFVDDLITYEASTIADLQKAFQEAVDDYLAFCEEVGKKPDATYKGSFNVRIGPQAHKDACAAAYRQGRTLNEFVRIAIEREVEHADTHNSVVEAHTYAVTLQEVAFQEPVETTWQQQTKTSQIVH